MTLLRATAALPASAQSWRPSGDPSSSSAALVVSRWCRTAPARCTARRRLRPVAPRAQQQPDDDFHANALPRLKKTSALEPSFALSQEDAVVAQLKALQHNNFPTIDAGLEIMYKFAAFDPFARSRYFGVSLDLGQFERFRRIFYTPCYTTLLCHSSHEFLSKLEISERLWKARVRVVNAYRREERVYEFTMERRFGGRYDGYWYTANLICDGCEDKTLYGVI